MVRETRTDGAGHQGTAGKVKRVSASLRNTATHYIFGENDLVEIQKCIREIGGEIKGFEYIFHGGTEELAVFRKHFPDAYRSRVIRRKRGDIERQEYTRTM